MLRYLTERRYGRRTHTDHGTATPSELPPMGSWSLRPWLSVDVGLQDQGVVHDYRVQFPHPHPRPFLGVFVEQRSGLKESEPSARMVGR